MCIVLHSGMVTLFSVAPLVEPVNSVKLLLFFCLCDSVSGLTRPVSFGAASASLPDN
jgi:hypothetical protein